MKSIEITRNQSFTAFTKDFLKAFMDDIEFVADSRKIKLNGTIIITIFYKLAGVMSVASEICKEEKDIEINLTRLEMEITKNNSLKFTAVPLNEDGDPVLPVERLISLLFLATDKDIRENPGRIGLIYTPPTDMPSSN